MASPEVVEELPPSSFCNPSFISVAATQYATSHGGSCIQGNCTVAQDCKVDANIRVVTNSPCRIGFVRDGVYVGGGANDVDIAINRTLECGDFEEVEIMLGGIEVYSVNFWCKNCTGQ